MSRGADCTRRAAPLALAFALGACRSTPPETAAPAQGVEPEATTDGAEVATEQPAQETDQETNVEDAETTEAHEQKLHGTLSLRYRGRWSRDDSDNDLFQLVTLDYGDPSRDRTSASLMGRLSADLDGRGGDGSSLSSLEDTYDEAVQDQLYYAFATLRDRGPFEVVRVGRQWLHDTPEFAWFDGLYLESHEHGDSLARVAAYGGRSVHPYESSTEGDALAGAWLEARPWKQGRARLDWMHAADETMLGSHDNDLLGIGLWQGFGDSLSAEVQHTRIDGEARDLRAAARWFSGEQDVSVNLAYYELLETQGELALEFDPFFAALHELFPFREARLSVSKGFGESLRTDAGIDFRRVSETNDIGEFNRDFDRGFLTLVFPELLPADIVLSATGDWWNASGSDITSGGAELSREWDHLEAAVGSYYSLFQYDWTTGEERDEVRVWYMRLHWKGSHDLDHELRYEYDDDDLENVQSLKWVSTWHF